MVNVLPMASIKVSSIFHNQIYVKLSLQKKKKQFYTTNTFYIRLRKSNLFVYKNGHKISTLDLVYVIEMIYLMNRNKRYFGRKASFASTVSVISSYPPCKDCNV